MRVPPLPGGEGSGAGQVEESKVYGPPPARAAFAAMLAPDGLFGPDSRRAHAGPEQPALRVVPGAPASFQALLPTLRRPGETIGTNGIRDAAAYARHAAFVDVIRHQGNEFQITESFWKELDATTAAVLRDGAAGTLVISTGLLEAEIPVAETGFEDRAFEAGGLGRRVRVFRLPDVDPHRTGAPGPHGRPAARRGQRPPRPRHALEDGAVARSSPVYLVRA